MSRTDSPALFNITATARLYQQIREPQPPKVAPKAAEPAPPLRLEWSEVQDILKKSRTPSIAELRYILEHAKELGLNARRRNELSVELTIALAADRQPRV